MMAINMMCMNSKCKHYWEDNCMRNINEERIEIDENGKCETFEEGISELYTAFGARIRLKEGWTETKIINRLNEALKFYEDSDCDSDGIIYITITKSEAETLFNDLFEGVTFEEYIAEHCQEDAEGEECDIAPMTSYFDDTVGENLIFSIGGKVFYKNS